ncbi:VP3 [Trichosanthes kirilowii gokushovirus]|nr:VP3 [Trichosanthes kirilowii gokushovirus]
MNIRLPYQYVPARIERGERQVSLTKSEFAHEANINTIVKRFNVTGVAPGRRGEPLQGNFEEVPDFQTMLNRVRDVEAKFSTLPAKVRKAFDHNPAALVSFMADPNNREKAVELGLIERPPERTRDVVQAVDELAAKLVPKA